MSEIEKHVETLAKKAADASDSADAMRFSQATLNLSNASIGLADLKKRSTETK